MRELGLKLEKINNIPCQKEHFDMKKDSTLQPILENLARNSSASIPNEIQMNHKELSFS